MDLGNHAFGWAWDRELTDADDAGHYPPYIELMAGAYTDNQPDFSYLLQYVGSPAFKPAAALDTDVLNKLLTPTEQADDE